MMEPNLPGFNIKDELVNSYVFLIQGILAIKEN